MREVEDAPFESTLEGVLWGPGAPPCGQEVHSTSCCYLGPLPSADLGHRVNPGSLKGWGWADIRPFISLRLPQAVCEWWCVDSWTLGLYFKSVWTSCPVTGLH